MTRENWPPHWDQEPIDRLEANPLWQKYSATHPMKEDGRDLEDIRAFVQTICDGSIDKIISSPV